jgi:hypothetical protein
MIIMTPANKLSPTAQPMPPAAGGDAEELWSACAACRGADILASCEIWIRRSGEDRRVVMARRRHP